MWVLVSYDVSTETPEGRKRLRRVAQICKNYGQRVQKSVFECQVNEMKFEELRRELLRIINKDEDNLRLYRLTEPRERHVESYGLIKTILFDDEPLIA
ncbi:MAG: CRISPR-associated endonuclease Cas2 [Nitrospirae bacterium]|nr:CRISPR-associated endonuclease Cas2 [Nitrospirota bacterium]